MTTNSIATTNSHQGRMLRRRETLKVKALQGVRRNPGSQALAFPLAQRRFLRELEREGRIEWRRDNEGQNEGWYECQPSDPYEQDSIHGRSKNQ